MAVYLDYNATAPIRPSAKEAVIDAMGYIGNASSIHAFGRKARGVIEKARDSVAQLCGVSPGQIIFNGGATESNNTVLKAFHNQPVLISSIEHLSVLEPASQAIQIPVLPNGQVDLEAFQRLLNTENPALVSIMAVNSETGVIQPIEAIAKYAKESGALVHCDAVQAAGRIDLKPIAGYVDFISLSAHKIGGPGGVGALVLAGCGPDQCPVPLKLLHGGGQERSQRAGTENIAGIAGFGAAAEEAFNDLKNTIPALQAMRDQMESRLKAAIEDLVIYGMESPRVANTSKMAIPGIPANTWLMNFDLKGFALSSGSACSSGKVHASHVLQAMGVSPQEAGSAIRVSLGWATTQDEVNKFIDCFIELYGRLRHKKQVSHA